MERFVGIGYAGLTMAADQHNKRVLQPTGTNDVKRMFSNSVPVADEPPVVASHSTILTSKKATTTRLPSSSKRTPPKPETLVQPPSIRSARNSVHNSIDMTIERSNSMVIVDELVQDRQRDVVTILVGALFCLSMVSALAAMYTEASIAAYIAFTLPLFVAPYVLHQRAKINQLPTLRTAITKCQSQVSRITSENIQLHASITRLSGQLKQLAFVDDRLSDVAKAINVDPTALRMLIYTNANLQRQITKALQARDLQALFTSFLACAHDKDNVRTIKEREQLLVRLDAFGTGLPRDILRSALEGASIRKRKAAATQFNSTVNTEPTRGCCDCYVLSST